MDNTNGFELRKWFQVQLHFQGRCQRSFTSGDELAQIPFEGTDELIQVVSAHAPQYFGESLFDLIPVCFDDLPELPVNFTFTILLQRLRRILLLRALL